jgi:putative salt-induced outer membrane protein YdiY
MIGTEASSDPGRRPAMRVAIVAAVVAVLSSSALADEVGLASGERLIGTIVEKDATTVVLQHGILGRLEIPAEKVTFTWVDEIAKQEREAAVRAADGKAAIAGKKDADAAAASVAVPAKPADPWKVALEVGLNGAEGNSDSLNGRAGLVAAREDDGGRWKLDASWDVGEADGTRTKNRFTAGAHRDFKTKWDRWTFFGDARYDRDQFTEWDQRASISGGAGYALVKRDAFTAALRFGAAGTKEWGSMDDDHVRPEGLLGGDVTWKPAGIHEIGAGSTWYPDLADGPEYRLVSYATWKIRLDEKGAVSLRLGVDHELDTHRAPPFKRQDVRYFALLIVEF